jgi:RNA polymerase primary sigma factor
MSEITDEETLHMPYDNLPIGPGSLPPQDVQNHWQIHIDKVDQPERERRLLREPMELVLAHCGAYPPISHDRSLELVEHARAGDIDAREKLILHFQRFVIHFAKEAFPQARHLNVPMEDVVQDGMVGLIAAGDKTDPEIAKQKDGSIRSYLAMGIKRAIHKNFTDTSRLVRLPAHLHNQARSLINIDSALRAELGREPTDFEIAKRAGMVPPKPPELIGIGESEEYDEFTGERPEYVINRARMEFARSMKKASSNVGPIMQAARPIKCLDSYTRDRLGEIRPLHETLADEDSRSEILEQAHLSALRDRLGEAMAELDERQQAVLEMRYGLDGDEPKTLEEVGRALNVTRERIRQIENQAIKKLRNTLEGITIEGEDGTSYTPPTRTYTDHIAEVMEYERKGKPIPYWLQDEADDIKEQQQAHTQVLIAKRQQAETAANLSENLERLAKEYVSKHEETERDEARFASAYHNAMGNTAKAELAQKAPKRYEGLAAFTVLSLKPGFMLDSAAWEIAQRTIINVLENFDPNGEKRFANTYYQTVRQIFERMTPASHAKQKSQAFEPAAEII